MQVEVLTNQIALESFQQARAVFVELFGESDEIVKRVEEEIDKRTH